MAWSLEARVLLAFALGFGLGVNRYSPSARGVTVMRLAEGDRVVGIAAFRPGLAEQGSIGDNDDPGTGPDEGPTRGA